MKENDGIETTTMNIYSTGAIDMLSKSKSSGLTSGSFCWLLYHVFMLTRPQRNSPCRNEDQLRLNFHEIQQANGCEMQTKYECFVGHSAASLTAARAMQPHAAQKKKGRNTGRFNTSRKKQCGTVFKYIIFRPENCRIISKV